MGDVLRGARLAIGAAPVVLAVLFSLVRFAEWRWENAVSQAITERDEGDAILLRNGPGSSTAEQLRYLELIDKAE
jgi:hypothetical protein